MIKHFLLGDQAIAQGALDAGMSGVYAYPGTPSTEITEYIQEHPLTKERGIHSRWCTNEKTAMEAALGMSYAGKRALVCMKHVGLNVAADPFVNSAITAVNGGVVVLVADDPGMHSSKDEQDSSYYGKFAMIPMLVLIKQQTAYDMIGMAFDMSETLHLPILVRIVTRLAHSRAVVNVAETPRPTNELNNNSVAQDWVLLPVNARRRNAIVCAQQKDLMQLSEVSSYNSYLEGSDKSLGIIASGIGYNYVMENFPDGCTYPILKISQYPLPHGLINRMTAECDKVLIVEDGQPFIEEQVRGIMPGNSIIVGRLDDTLPRTGELNPDLVRKALGMDSNQTFGANEIVVPRPPALCQGCGHRDVYIALNQVLQDYEGARVFGDIGCYTLGALPPYRAIHTCVDMGASITMAKGASDGGLWPAVAVIGDSTFNHSCMTGLIDCVNSNYDVTIIISDNETTGMTGGQDSAGTGKVEEIVAGLGVDPQHIRVFEPLKKNMDQMMQIIDEEINYHGVSVIIPRRECIQTLKRKKK